MLARHPDLHVLRDPTRGGLATSLNEIAPASGVGIALDERALPDPRDGRQRLRDPRPRPAVRGQRGQAGRVRRARGRRRGAGRDARPPARRAAPWSIGECVAEHPGMVSARTGFGAPGSSTCPSASSCRGSADHEVPGHCGTSSSRCCREAMVRAIARMPEYGERLQRAGQGRSPATTSSVPTAAPGSTTSSRTRSSSGSWRWHLSSTSPATPSTVGRHVWRAFMTTTDRKAASSPSPPPNRSTSTSSACTATCWSANGYAYDGVSSA